MALGSRVPPLIPAARFAGLPLRPFAPLPGLLCFAIPNALGLVGFGNIGRRLAQNLPPTRAASPIDRVLDGAIVTAPAERDPALMARLHAVAGRLFHA